MANDQQDQGQQAPQQNQQPGNQRVDIRVEPRQDRNGNGGNPTNRVPLEDRIAAAVAAAMDARDRRQQAQQPAPAQPRAAAPAPQPAAPAPRGITPMQFWGGVAAVCVVAFLAIGVFRTPVGGFNPPPGFNPLGKSAAASQGPWVETGGRLPSAEVRSKAAEQGWHVVKGYPGDGICPVGATRCENRWVKIKN